MFLSLMLALKRLGTAASAKAEESRESVITARHIEQVFAVSAVCVCVRITLCTMCVCGHACVC